MSMSTDRFLNLFPTPAFLRMPAVGVDISDKAIRYVAFKRKDGRLRVASFGERQLPSSLVGKENVAKEAALKDILKKMRGEVGLYYVNASLPEEKAYLFKTEISETAKSEIRTTLELRLEEFVPLKASEAFFDYDLIPESGHTGGHLDISVSVLPKSTVNDYLGLFLASSLMPLSFEVEAQAVARSVIRKGDRRTHMLVNIGKTKTGLAIVSDEVVHFTSTIPIGGDSLTAAVEKHRNVSFAEAEKIKKELGLIASQKDTELFFSLMSILSVLRDEMNRLNQYWSTRKHINGEERKIDLVVFSGSEAALPGFDEYFSMSFRTPVELANVWTNVASFDEYIPPIPFVSSLDYAAAIGLGLSRLI